MDHTQVVSQFNSQYTSPEVLVFYIEVENGFLVSAGKPGSEDNIVPGVDKGQGARTIFPQHSF